MKHKVGEMVRFKSKKWFDEHKNENGVVTFYDGELKFGRCDFDDRDYKIENINGKYYELRLDDDTLLCVVEEQLEDCDIEPDKVQHKQHEHVEDLKEEVFPKVELDGCNFDESYYKRGAYHYTASSLYRHAEKLGLKPFKYPLACFDLSGEQASMRDLNLYDFANHVKRVMEADISIPIILDDYGMVADGIHRCIRAICEGKSYIMAYRLTSMPEYDYKDSESEENN